METSFPLDLTVWDPPVLSTEGPTLLSGSPSDFTIVFPIVHTPYKHY